jgi:LmbE family N-acetylglucosaminyl deacetylase
VKFLLVAAHPDDETVGAAIKMSRMDASLVTILHITNGSPRDMQDARANGFATAEAYELARRSELHEAMALVGIRPEQCRYLNISDKEACSHPAFLTGQIGALVRELRPDVVCTHAYEGGHPDHDSASFAVRQAVFDPSEVRRPAVIEFACYFAGPDGLETGRFLPGTGDPAEIIVLKPEERRLKQAMLDCFRSQRRVLESFPPDRECFRPAPVYDYSKAPHGGKLHYENHGWGITGQTWREMVAQAVTPA